MLQNDTKKEIVQRAQLYMAENGLTAGAFATLADVTDSYLSAMLNGKLEIAGAGDKSTLIKDSYFMKVAKAIGMELKKAYWKFVATAEFTEMVGQLEEAKKKSLAKALVCLTGWGKSDVTERFKLKNPNHTYVVVINSEMNLGDIINELMYQMNLPEKGTRAMRIRACILKFRDIKRNGGYPILIMDEAENMNGRTMRLIKGLYDGICQGGYASIVLMGTDQLISKMESNKVKDKEAAPQFYRRFKAGIRLVTPESKKAAFGRFFDALGVRDNGLQRLLIDKCDNYGELRDYLERALREADEQGEELTEEYFRVMYNMPDYGKKAA